MSLFTWPIRVYYEDTDSGGVVYYANYLRFMERARTEWLRSLGIEQDRLRQEERVIFAVRSVSVDYFSPARFNDQLNVTVAVVKRGGASWTFEQKISRLDGEQQIALCLGVTKVACLDAEAFHSRPIPKQIQLEIQRVN